MPVDRFFLDSPFQAHNSSKIEGEEFEHMKVLRLEPGEDLELVNGKGELAFARLVSMEKRNAVVEIEKVHRAKPPTLKCILAIGIPRLPKLEFILEKGCELGVSSFWLFAADFSEKTLFSPHQKVRQKHILVSAMKQCGRLDLPSIEEFSSLSAVPSFDGATFFGDVRKEAPLLISQISSPPKDTLFFTGPEKGFSPKEILLLEKRATGVHLNPHILRAETAAIAAAAILCHWDRFL